MPGAVVGFTDVSGRFRTLYVSDKVLRDLMDGGIDIDGSSIGVSPVNDSDVVIRGVKELGEIMGKRFVLAEMEKHDPRARLREFLESMDYGASFASEIEFFILKDGKPADAMGYFSAFDPLMGIRDEMVEALSQFMEVEVSHHEVAPGQGEINFRYGDPVETADRVQVYKQVLRIVARRRGYDVTFMPKPFEGMNGSGMHTHVNLERNGENVFRGFSREMGYFLGGILEHARALSFLASPAVNSYKRLVPNHEAPVYICWGRRNRSAMVRIPHGDNRIEYRAPDPMANPYLLYLGILAAGLDGIKRKIDPGEPVEEEAYHADLETLPMSLYEAMKEFERDEVLREALGDIYPVYRKEKLREILEEKRHISPWERERYMYL